MDDEKIKAVDDQDLVSLLESLGELENVNQGKQECVYCHSTITLENIEGIIPLDGRVVFSCARSECSMRLMSERG